MFKIESSKSVEITRKQEPTTNSNTAALLSLFKNVTDEQRMNRKRKHEDPVQG